MNGKGQKPVFLENNSSRDRLREILTKTSIIILTTMLQFTLISVTLTSLINVNTANLQE